jgi:2-polyprenyl-6-methoxyphenol hydroxylase-like FAD-dependent oxidoreductase
MNTGIQDAMALAAVLSEGKDLDAYEAQRRPVAAGVVALTDRMTRVATLRNRPLIAVRNTVLPLIGHIPAVRRGLAMNLSELSTIQRGNGQRQGKVA